MTKRRLRLLLPMSIPVRGTLIFCEKQVMWRCDDAVVEKFSDAVMWDRGSLSSQIRKLIYSCKVLLGGIKDRVLSLKCEVAMTKFDKVWHDSSVTFGRATSDLWDGEPGAVELGPPEREEVHHQVHPQVHHQVHHQVHQQGSKPPIDLENPLMTCWWENELQPLQFWFSSGIRNWMEITQTVSNKKTKTNTYQQSGSV